jgi:predicted HTH transcriptional regulator
MDKPTLRALGQNPDGLSIKEILPLIGLTPDDIDYQNCLRKILDSLLLQGKIVKLQVRRGRSNPLIYALVQDAKRIEAGQSRQEKLLLRLVSNNPGASISTIRRKTGFGSKSVTDLLTNLANRGLIKREVGGRYANRSSKSGLWYKYYVNSER